MSPNTKKQPNRRTILNELTIPQLRKIAKTHDIVLPSRATKTGIISRLMVLSKSILYKEYCKYY